MSAGILRPVRDMVLSRAGGRCERCGQLTDTLELHHRKYRSRGGEHSLSNLVALCGWGNHTGCHGWAHTSPDARAHGYAIPSWVSSAAEVPLLVPSAGGSKRWVRHTDDIRRERVAVTSERAKQALYDLGITQVPA